MKRGHSFLALGALFAVAYAPLVMRAQTSGPRKLTTADAYRLQVGDSITVLYRITPEYNQTVSVQPDGAVNLELLGSIPVRGLTLEEVHDRVKQAAAKRLRDPEVSIELKDFEKPHFTVLGEVANPGRFELRGALTIEDALAMAGGLKVSARHTNILVITPINDQIGSTQLFSYKQLEKHKAGTELIALRPGDLIIVPESNFSKVERYVKLVNPGIFINPVGNF